MSIPPPSAPGQAFSTESDLRRGLGPLEATTFVIGAIIGAGIFRTPSLVAAEMGAPGPTMLLWILGGVVALCGALTVAELGGMMPRAGGMVVYLREAYPPVVPFLCSWLMFWVFRPASAAAIATVFAEYCEASLAHFVATPPWTVKVIALASLWALGLATIRGITVSGMIQNLATFLKLAGIGVIIVLGLTLDVGTVEHLTPLWPDDWATPIAGFGTAMIACTYSYGGWDASAGLAEEIEDPRRNVPRSIFFGTGVVIFVYLALNATYLFVLPFETISEPGALVAADTMEALAGSVGLMFISGAVMISTFGVMHNGVVVNPRAYFSMAREGLFFRGVARVHARYQTPWVAVACHVGGATVVLLTLPDFGAMLRTSAPAGFIFVILGICSIFVMRRKAPDAERPYRTWGYPVTPALFVLVGVLYLGSVAVTRPDSFLPAAVMAVVGLVAWRFWFRPRLPDLEG